MRHERVSSYVSNREELAMITTIQCPFCHRKMCADASWEECNGLAMMCLACGQEFTIDETMLVSEEPAPPSPPAGSSACQSSASEQEGDVEIVAELPRRPQSAIDSVLLWIAIILTIGPVVVGLILYKTEGAKDEQKSQSIRCANELGQFGYYLNTLAEEKGGSFPTNQEWQEKMEAEGFSVDFQCPEDGMPYEYLAGGLNLQSLKESGRAAQTPLVRCPSHHTVYCDGHRE